MAKVKVIGNAMVVTSALKMEELKKLEKFSPASLILKDEKDEPIFKISAGNNGKLNGVSAVFNGVSHDGQGYATLTMGVNVGQNEDVKEVVTEVFATALMRLNKLEAQLPDVLRTLEQDFISVKSCITVE